MLEIRETENVYILFDTVLDCAICADSNKQALEATLQATNSNFTAEGKYIGYDYGNYEEDIVAYTCY